MGMPFKPSTVQPTMLSKTKDRAAKLAAAADSQGIAAKAKKNDLLPNAEMKLRAIVDLKPSKKRAHKTNALQQKALQTNIAEIGFLGAILVQGNEIIDGHARWEAMKALGQTHIWVIDVGKLSDAELAYVRVGFNRISELGEWDMPMLREMVIEVQGSGLAIEGLGFTDVLLDVIKLDPLDETHDLNDLPGVPDGAPTAREGDIFVMNKHRLACGSALDGETYNNLILSDVVHAVLTDPPYNVPIANNVSGLGAVKHGEFVEASGEKSDEEFLHFLITFLTLAKARLMKGGAVFVFMDHGHIDLLFRAGHAAGLFRLNLVVWDKQVGAMGGLYRSTHELVAVFCSDKSPAINNVKLGVNGRNRCNMWRYPGANRKGSSANKILKFHPTPKPVEMLVDAMLDVTLEGQIVLDPFMGSGSTIVAAEECQRCARGIEKDPKYVDLAILRWERLTGCDAVLEKTGETFAEVQARRAAEAANQI